MTLADIPEVKVDLDARSFIIAVVTDANGSTKTIMRGIGPHNPLHQCYALDHPDTLKCVHLAELDGNFDIRCVGGGMIDVITDQKRIVILGKSGTFGKEPNRPETIRMLSEAFPEFQVSEWLH